MTLNQEDSTRAWELFKRLNPYSPVITADALVEMCNYMLKLEDRIKEIESNDKPSKKEEK